MKAMELLGLHAAILAGLFVTLVIVGTLYFYFADRRRSHRWHSRF